MLSRKGKYKFFIIELLLNIKKNQEFHSNQETLREEHYGSFQSRLKCDSKTQHIDLPWELTKAHEMLTLMAPRT